MVGAAGHKNLLEVVWIVHSDLPVVLASLHDDCTLRSTRIAKEADGFELAFGREFGIPESCASAPTTPATDPTDSNGSAAA